MARSANSLRFSRLFVLTRLLRFTRIARLTKFLHLFGGDSHFGDKKTSTRLSAQPHHILSPQEKQLLNDEKNHPFESAKREEKLASGKFK